MGVVCFIFVWPPHHMVIRLSLLDRDAFVVRTPVAGSSNRKKSARDEVDTPVAGGGAGAGAGGSSCIDHDVSYRFALLPLGHVQSSLARIL